MSEDNPINPFLVWRQTVSARIRANDPKVVNPNMSAEERAKMADALDVGSFGVVLPITEMEGEYPMQGKTGTFPDSGLFVAIGSYDKEHDVMAVEFNWDERSILLDLGFARTVANSLHDACEHAEKLRAEIKTAK